MRALERARGIRVSPAEPIPAVGKAKDAVSALVDYRRALASEALRVWVCTGRTKGALAAIRPSAEDQSERFVTSETRSQVITFSLLDGIARRQAAARPVPSRSRREAKA